MRRSQSLAALLERDLIERGCTVVEQAARIGVDRGAIYRWRAGYRPSPRAVGRIAAALGLPIDDVIAALPPARERAAS